MSILIEGTDLPILNVKRPIEIKGTFIIHKKKAYFSFDGFVEPKMFDVKILPDDENMVFPEKINPDDIDNLRFV